MNVSITTSSAKPDAMARGMLAVVCVALFVFGIIQTGHSAETVDVRTYVEMMRGISLHGLPYLDNGPVDRFVALGAPWNVYTNGRFWGIYGPVYPYFAAPFLLLGGLRLATVVTFLLTIPIAIVTFFMGRRVLEEERHAVGAAIVAVASTPILAKSLQLTAYPLLAFFALLSTHATLVAIGSKGRARMKWSALAGVFFALGSATHLLCFPMSVALLGVLAVTDTTSPVEVRTPGGSKGLLARTILRSFWPTRETLPGAGLAVATMMIFLAPAMWLNRMRFGTLNPFTYGPAPWRGSTLSGVTNQTLSGHLSYAAPVILLLAVVMAAFFVASVLTNRRHRLIACCVTIFVAAAAIARSVTLRERGWALVKTSFAYIFDQSIVDLDLPYVREAGLYGHLLGPWVIRATLQCTPIFFLVFALPRVDVKKRGEFFALLAPCVALYAYLALRANLPLHSALGFPWVHTRYTLPALPIFAILSVFAARTVGLRVRDLALGLFILVVTIVWLNHGYNDRSGARQIVLLALPLILGVAATLAVRWKKIPRRVAALLVVVIGGLGIGTTIGHDLRAHLDGKSWGNHRIDTMARIAPERFALLGYLPPMEPILALRGSRDVQYGDLYQLDDWTKARSLVEHWLDEGRPTYVVVDFDQSIASPWPGISFDLVDEHDMKIYVVTKRQTP